MSGTSLHRRLATVLAGLFAIVGTTLVVVPAATAATETRQSAVALKEIATSPVGGTVSITGQVYNPVTNGYLEWGTVTLQRQLAGEPGFTAVGTAAVTKNFTFQVPALRNANYRVDFSGATVPVGTNSIQYVPSSSAIASGPVMRTMNLGFPAKFRRSFPVRIAVGEGYVKAPVFIQIDRSCVGAWRGFGKARTNKWGVAKKRLRLRGTQTCYRFVVPGDANYVENAQGVRAHRF